MKHSIKIVTLGLSFLLANGGDAYAQEIEDKRLPWRISQEKLPISVTQNQLEACFLRQSGRDFLTNTYPLDDGKGVGIDFGVDGGLFREREFFGGVKIYDKHIDIVYRRPMSAKRIYKQVYKYAKFCIPKDVQNWPSHK